MDQKKTHDRLIPFPARPPIPGCLRPDRSGPPAIVVENAAEITADDVCRGADEWWADAEYGRVAHVDHTCRTDADQAPSSVAEEWELIGVRDEPDEPVMSWPDLGAVFCEDQDTLTISGDGCLDPSDPPPGATEDSASPADIDAADSGLADADSSADPDILLFRPRLRLVPE